MSADFNDFKEQVRSQADIVEVVSGYVALKNADEITGAAVLFTGKRHRLFLLTLKRACFTVLAVMRAVMFSALL